MSIQQVVSRSLAAAFVLSIAGLAAARQPPALVRAQAATSYAVACEGAPAQSGAGYRDAVARSTVREAVSARAMAKAGAGYRDLLVRTNAPNSGVLAACVNPPQLTASR